MNKKFLSMAAAAMMFAACSDDLKVDQAVPEIAQNPTEATAEQVPVQFGAAYVDRATTRAGLTETLVTGTYADNNGLYKSGFGVFGYYTDSELYNADSFKPNFMYNTYVHATAADQWSYEPVRYWPNEYGVDAVSDDVDRVSFFAYAPYVTVNASTGNVTNNSTSTYLEDNGSAVGIVGLSRNTAFGDPFVKYVASLDPSKAVDLTYGRALNSIQRQGLDPLAAGASMLDLSKPAVGTKLGFSFQHALAALNVQVDAAVDALTPGTQLGTEADGSTVDEMTRIYVRSITFEGLTDKGMLNLRDGNWYDENGQYGVDGTLAIYDGRNNGREAVMAAVNESPTNLNSVIVQMDDGHQPNSPVGVTATAVNLFQPATTIPAKPADYDTNSTSAAAYDAVVAQALEEPIYVIPTGQVLRATIVYDVETKDPNLPGNLSGSGTKGISVENAITKEVSSTFILEKAKLYTLKLHLGMASVQFEASVSDWPDPATSTTAADIHLPGNIAGSMSDLLSAPYPAQSIATIEAMAESAEKTAAMETMRDTYIGKYVDKDGNISSSVNDNTVGIIAQIEFEDNKIDASSSMTTKRVLVIASKNASIKDPVDGVTELYQMPWWGFAQDNSDNTPTKSVTGVAPFSSFKLDPTDGYYIRIKYATDNSEYFKFNQTSTNDLFTWSASTSNDNGWGNVTPTGGSANVINGYDVTEAWNDYANAAYYTPADNDAHSYSNVASGNTSAAKYYYALKAAVDYVAYDGATAGDPVISGASTWFLPTAKQMINMGAADKRSGGTPTGKEYASGVFKTAITSGNYWSVSEYGSASAWVYYAGNGYWGNYGKVYSGYVRPVFAY